MKRTAVYPFTAIVGQEEMKLSLILNVINPALGPRRAAAADGGRARMSLPL